MKQPHINIRAILIATVLSIIGLVVVGLSGYSYAYRDRLFPVKSTVVIYGRESCGITKAVRAGLTEKGVPYLFANADIQAIDDEMWYKLGAKFKEPQITFPIVQVAGKILLTPSVERIQQELIEYTASAAQMSERDYSTLLNGADPVPHY